MPRISETATRAKLIDPLLTEAGWNLKDRTQVDFEIPVDGYDKEPWNGVTDYCLYHPSGEVLAVVATTVSFILALFTAHPQAAEAVLVAVFAGFEEP